MSYNLREFEQFEENANNIQSTSSQENLIELDSAKENNQPSMESQMMSQFMQMMKTMEENRKATEDKLLNLLTSNQPRNETLYRVLPDFSQTIANFDGETLGKTALDWLSSLESTALLHNWPQEVLLETAKVHLVGSARKWYSEKSSKIKSFDDFKNAFKKTFSIRQNRDELWEKIRKRYQGRNENIFSYFHDKVTLCQALDFEFHEIKEQVLIGLYNKQIVPGLVATRADNLDDLLHEIVEFDRITTRSHHGHFSFGQKFSKSTQGSNEKPPVAKNNVVKEGSTKEFTRLPPRDENNKPLCFICKKYGHVSKYCRSKATIKCFDCKKEGHIASDCPERKAESKTSTNSASQLMIQGNPKMADPVDKYLRDIKVNNKSVQALIDPGSAVCTVKQSVVKDAKLLCEPISQTLYGFGETKTVCDWQTQLAIQIDNVEANVTALVVPDQVQPTDILLGRTFTELPSVAYVKVGNVLYFGQEDEPLFSNLEMTVTAERKPITVESDTTLLQNRINFVKVEGNQFLPVMNISGEEIELTRGHKVGEVRGSDKEEDYQKTVKKAHITKDEVRFDNVLDDNEQYELLKLMNSYRDVFATEIKELGCTEMMEVKIEDTGDPVRSKPYRTNQKDGDTNSPYASPGLLVPKSSGEKMAHVDCLSRAATESPSESETIDEIYEKLNVFLIIPEEERILMIQRSDKKLSNLIEILQKEEYDRSNDEKHLTNQYELNKGRLYRKVKVNKEERWLYVIPDSMRKATVIKYHDQMGHWSVDRTVTHILQKFWFRGLRSYIKRHIRGCFECLMEKVPGGKKSGKLHPPVLPERPMIKLHIDHLGPFQKSTKGNQHILVIVDAYTRFVRLYPVKTTKSNESSRKMEEFINQYGVPRVIVSDQATSFTGQHFLELCTKYDIEHKTIASHYPQANGMAENRMKSIVPVIVTSLDFEDDEWDRKIYMVERKLNTAFNKTLTCSPFQCLYGYIPTFEDAGIVNIANRNEDLQPIQEMRYQVRKRVAENQEKYKKYYDKTHFDGVEYNVGDIVAIKRKPTHTGEPTKTQLKYRGPLVIIEKLPSDCYRLEKLNKEDGGKTFTTISHVSQMKIYQNHEDNDLTEEEDDDEGEYQTGEVEIRETEESDETEPESDEEDTEWKPEGGNEEDPNQTERPHRKRRPPPKLTDYVWGQTLLQDRPTGVNKEEEAENEEKREERRRGRVESNTNVASERSRYKL